MSKDNSNIKVSISVVVYFTEIETLRGLLDSLCSNIVSKAFCLHLIIIDNSCDVEYQRNLKALVKKYTSCDGFILEVLYSQNNVGYGQGNNKILSKLDSNYHLILNPDVILKPDVLDVCVKKMAFDDSIVMITPKILDPLASPSHVVKDYPNCLVLFLRYLGNPTINRLFRRKLENYARKDLGGSSNSQILLAGGCFMFLRTEALTKIDGFDANFFMYFEDFDLCLRLREYGKIVYEPFAEIEHAGGDVGRKNYRHHLFFIASAFKFFNKHGWKIF